MSRPGSGGRSGTTGIGVGGEDPLLVEVGGDWEVSETKSER